MKHSKNLAYSLIDVVVRFVVVVGRTVVGRVVVGRVVVGRVVVGRVVVVVETDDVVTLEFSGGHTCGTASANG